MALFLLDEAQFNALRSDLQSLTTAVNSLSDNVGKWQGTQTDAIQAGLASLVSAITGADVEAIQQQIDQHATGIRAVRESLQSSVNRNQPKGDID